MTLCYVVNHSDISLLCYAMREVYLILQAPSAFKPKYAHEIMRQVYYFDIKVADHIFQKAYLANFLVNFQELSDLFYKIDLLLEHQNGKFKQFRIDRGSSFNESDKMF